MSEANREAWKDALRKEQEDGVLLNCLERLITKISGQNIDNINKYTENMTTLVSSLKDGIAKDTPLWLCQLKQE